MTSLFDPGKSDRNAASAKANQGIFTGGSATGAGGVTAGFDFSGGKANVTGGLGSFEGLMQQLQGLGGFGADLAQQGLPPELLALGQGTISELGQIDVNSNKNQFGQKALKQLVKADLKTATADPFDLGQGIADKLRERESARQDRKVASTFDRLKATGKLGTTGCAGIAGELDRSLSDQNLGFDIAGLNFGAGRQDAARGGVLGGTQGLESIHGRNFAESFQIENLEGNRALQQFGVGEQLHSSMLDQIGTGTGVAGQGAQIAALLQQLPAGMLEQLLAAGGSSSSSFFNAAGIDQGNAQMAKSPLLEAIKTAGSFIKPFDFN
jgi:hypothetical protein